MLHVLVGRHCNNNCLFCMEEDRQGRAEHIENQSDADVRRMIMDYPQTDEILFTSGEPTLCPSLPHYVSLAKERGFRVIGLISNGRRLAYPGYLQDLVERGLNRVTISVHGHTAKLHDGLTRTPGSFAQTRTGLANCSMLKRTRALRVHTSTVITRRNLPVVADILALLRSLDVDEMVFNVMMAKGRGARHFETLMPSYAEVVRAFVDVHRTVSEADARRIRVVDMPPCVLRKLPNGMGGESEEYDQYEPTGSTGLHGLEVLNPASCSEEQHARPIRGRAKQLTERFGHGGIKAFWVRGRYHAATALARVRRAAERPAELAAVDKTGNAARTITSLRRAVSVPAISESRDYYVTQRSFKDRFLRVKGPPCDRCALRNSCAGVWEVYAERFGWNEFEPID